MIFNLYFLFFLFVIITPFQSIQAQMAIVETFTTRQCSAGPDADRIFDTIVTQYDDLDNVIMLNCNADSTNNQTTRIEGCLKRVSSYFNNHVIDSSALPTTVMNGVFNVRATDETRMRQALDMVKSTSDIPRIDIIYRDERLIFSTPDISQNEDQVYGWLVGYALHKIGADTQSDITETTPETNFNVTTFVEPIDLIDQTESLVIDVKHAKADAYAVLFQNADSSFIAAGKIVVPNETTESLDNSKIH